MSVRPPRNRNARYNVADKKASLRAARKVFKRRDTHHRRAQHDARIGGPLANQYYPRRAHVNYMELSRVESDLRVLRRWEKEDQALGAWLDE